MIKKYCVLHLYYTQKHCNFWIMIYNSIYSLLLLMRFSFAGNAQTKRAVAGPKTKKPSIEDLYSFAIFKQSIIKEPTILNKKAIITKPTLLIILPRINFSISTFKQILKHIKKDTTYVASAKK